MTPLPAEPHPLPLARLSLGQVMARWALAAGACMVTGVIALGVYGVRGVGAVTHDFAHLPFLDAFLRWDAGWYVRVATEGHSLTPNALGQTDLAFFPLYPLLIHGVAALGLSPYVAGYLVSAASGVLALGVFARWVETVLGPVKMGPAVWALVLWPFAFFLYGALYSDALFLFLAAAAFLALERDRVGMAALLGALATATRPLAPAVVLGLLLRQLERRRQANETLRARDALLVFAGAGLVAFMAYLQWRFQRPLAFVEAQRAWGQSPGLSTWLKLDFIHQARLRTPYAFIHLACVTVLLVCSIRMPRQLGVGYAVYSALVLGIGLASTRNFVNVGRYALAAFPCFAMLGETLYARPAWRRWAAAVSGGAMLLLFSKFAIGRFVA